jgi:hypothetical protein
VVFMLKRIVLVRSNRLTMKCLGLNGLNKSTHFIKRVKRVITGYSRVMFRLKGLTCLVKQGSVMVYPY